MGRTKLAEQAHKYPMSHAILEIDGIEFRAESGARVLDILDDFPERPALPFACRGGNCGICRVRVLEGECALEQPTAAELAQLAQYGAQPGNGERLGCQICVSPHANGARVRLQSIQRKT
ncbi:MAG TPA: 2Fe-2S iron-sulfur cluster-binding protein [Polyangiales bacterium]|nr:2Fe-2S iron-sulfur cluster-binding protein [Polyangiales bacterium]